MLLNYFSKILTLDIYFFISLIINIFSLLIFQRLSEDKRKNFFNKILKFTIFIFLFYSIILSIGQYFLWKNHPLSKFLLPPHQPIFYFLSYVFFNFFRDLFFRLVGLGLVIIIIHLIILVFKRDPFFEDEREIIPLISLFFSFPFNFFIIFLSFIILLLGGMFSIFLLRESKYFSFRNFWLIYSLGLLLLEPLIFQKFSFLIFLKP